MKLLIAILLIIFSFQEIEAQSAVKQYYNLPRPERFWVLTHIFKAKRALNISKEARVKADSIANTTTLDGDKNGGQVDAFRHSYWQARLTQGIGKRASYKLGKAHEKGSYIYYKRHKLEDGTIPDKISSDMDLYNNKVGASIVFRREELTKKEIEAEVIKLIKNGIMKIIAKDKKGNFLDCDGNIIEKETLKGKWENNKCLVNSNYNP